MRNCLLTTAAVAALLAAAPASAADLPARQYAAPAPAYAPVPVHT